MILVLHLLQWAMHTLDCHECLPVQVSIAMYTTQEKVLDGAVTMVNVVYPEMLTDHDRSIAKEHSSNKVTYDMSHLDETTRSMYSFDISIGRLQQANKLNV